ncbi:hypothetical protein IPG41_01660 [Candidatus Peregrinibacteria bacterium]|nr:MAG: hypothetical protein IPG41_01660 [Candidatus Peregrinibacteria bacterium]
MEKTLKNLASVSLLFLVLTGGLHLSATFLWIQGEQNATLKLFSQSLDLPFLLSALLYGSTRFSLSMEEATNKGKVFFIACSLVSALILSVALFTNFAFPDASLFR